MALSAKGENGEKIRAWLKTNHNVSASLSSVNRLVNRFAKERADIAKAVYKDAAANSANQDIKIIDEMVVNLNKEFMKAMAESDRQGMKHMADALHKFLQTRMDLSGINKPDSDKPEDETLQSLMDRIKNYDN